MIESLSGLSSFLHGWYGEPANGLALPQWKARVKAAPPLAEAWHLFGQLCKGGEAWKETGTCSPLACQDGLAGPNWIRETDGRIDFVFENQGNWSAGYKHADPSPDPDVFSNWAGMMETVSGHVPAGTVLSRFIITSALTETVFFGYRSPAKDEGIRQQLCDEIIWIGHYYNAAAFEGKYAVPSHRIRSNRERTLLALDWHGDYSGFIAKREFSRQRWTELKKRPGVM
jgi:hypothetical protein